MESEVGIVSDNPFFSLNPRRITDYGVDEEDNDEWESRRSFCVSGDERIFGDYYSGNNSRYAEDDDGNDDY